MVVASRRARARSGSEHSTWRATEAPASSSAIGPWRMTLPRSTMATASQVRSTSSRRWDDSTTVRPSATSDRIMSRISCIPAGSSPFMGSSRISSWGSPIRQAATPRRWRMPIEYFDTLSSARWRMPTRSRAGPMRFLRRRLPGGGQDLQVLPAGQVTVEPGLVDDGPHPGQGRGAVPGDVVAEQRHRAGVGMGQSQQHPDERGLAGAVGAQVAEGASPGDEELHAVHGDVLPEALGQPVGLHRPLAVSGLPVRDIDHGGGGHPSTLARRRRRRRRPVVAFPLHPEAQPAGVSSGRLLPREYGRKGGPGDVRTTGRSVGSMA